MTPFEELAPEWVVQPLWDPWLRVAKREERVEACSAVQEAREGDLPKEEEDFSLLSFRDMNSRCPSLLKMVLSRLGQERFNR